MQLLIKQLEYARGAPAAEENNSQMNLNFGGVLQWNLEWLKKVQYYDLSVGVTSCRFDMVCMQLFRWKKIKESRLSRRWCALLLLLFASISSFSLDYDDDWQRRRITHALPTFVYTSNSRCKPFVNFWMRTEKIMDVTKNRHQIKQLLLLQWGERSIANFAIRIWLLL